MEVEAHDCRACLNAVVRFVDVFRFDRGNIYASRRLDPYDVKTVRCRKGRWRDRDGRPVQISSVRSFLRTSRIVECPDFDSAEERSG
jgi:hypothetical protein